MNTPRTILAFTLALLISGIFTWSIGRTLGTRTKVTPRQFRQIVVASKDVAAGEAISAGSLAVSEWAAPQALAGSVTDPGAAIGRVALVSFVSGEPILLRKIADVGSGQGVSATIPRGMRAVTVRGPDVSAVSSFLEPGDLIDVIATCRLEGAEGCTSSTVLQAVRIFAVGDRTLPNHQHESVTASSLTLLVAPAEVGRLNLAMAGNRVTFALRNAMDTKQDGYADQEVAPKKGLAHAADLEKETHRPTKDQVPSQGTFVVETVAGGKMTTQSFEEARP